MDYTQDDRFISLQYLYVNALTPTVVVFRDGGLAFIVFFYYYIILIIEKEKNYLGKTPKAQAISYINDKLNFIKIKKN